MYYISELHMMDNEDGIPKLADYTDTFGPYKTLKKAREMFKKLVCKDKFLNHWDFIIRGPLHKIVRTPTYSHSTVYYNFKERD